MFHTWSSSCNELRTRTNHRLNSTTVRLQWSTVKSGFIYIWKHQDQRLPGYSVKILYNKYSKLVQLQYTTCQFINHIYIYISSMYVGWLKCYNVKYKETCIRSLRSKHIQKINYSTAMMLFFWRKKKLYSIC